MSVLFSLLFGLKRVLSAFWAWASKDPSRLIIVALLGLSAFLGLSNASLRSDKIHQQKIIALRDATIKQMVAANQTVTKRAKENIRRVRRLYAEIDEHAKQKLASDRAGNRAGLNQWLRQDDRNSARQTYCASQSEVSTGVVQDASQALVPVSDLEIASDNYSQLVSLIAWAQAIGQVETVPAE